MDHKNIKIINFNTGTTELRNVVVGDCVTDDGTKTGNVVNIDITSGNGCIEYLYTLDNGHRIFIKR